MGLFNKDNANESIENNVKDEEIKSGVINENVIVPQAYKTVRVRVPIDKLNEKELIVNVRINGKNTQITRGESIEVTENVAKVLEEAGLI